MKFVTKTSVTLLFVILGSAYLDTSRADDAQESSRTATFSSVTNVSSSTSTSNMTINVTNKSLPDDGASWETIRENGRVYVDKTKTLEYLLNCGKKLFFFNRPQRFGNTLFVQMMKSFFGGEKRLLFEGLSIYERGNVVHDETDVWKSLRKWTKYPVIHLDLNTMTYDDVPPPPSNAQKLKEFSNRLRDDLQYIARKYDVDREESKFRLTTLIRDLQYKFKLPVIILVDAYDSPINEAIHVKNNVELAEGLGKIVNNLLVEIRRNAEHVRFAWVTGVTKLDLEALESDGPNSFVDVTRTKELATLMGFTEEEIRSNFELHLNELSNAEKVEEKKLMELLRRTYGEYKFCMDDDNMVYNPQSVIKSLKNKRMGSYWCSAEGSLRYILRRFVKEKYVLSSFRGKKISREFLLKKRNMAVRQKIPLEVYMILTGYLKIEEYNEETGMVRLNYVNQETEESILNALEHYIPSEKKSLDEAEWLVPELTEALIRGANDMFQKFLYDFVAVLNRIKFPDYVNHEGWREDDPVVIEKEVTRRLFAILKSAGLCEKSRTFSSEFGDVRGAGKIPGELDSDTVVTTYGLPINYVIAVKYGEGENSTIVKGVEQLIRYVTAKIEQKITSFDEALGPTNRICLLILHFRSDDGEYFIDEWYFLPFRDTKFWVRNAQARVLNDDDVDFASLVHERKININYNYIVT